MKVPTALRWVLIALAGLLIAVAVAVLASKLTSQQIGLSSEPLEAGQSLAPPKHGPRDNDGRGHSGDNAQPPTTTATAPPQTTTSGTAPSVSSTTADDAGAEAGGEGSSDDD